MKAVDTDMNNKNGGSSDVDNSAKINHANHDKILAVISSLPLGACSKLSLNKEHQLFHVLQDCSLNKIPAKIINKKKVYLMCLIECKCLVKLLPQPHTQN